MHSHRMVKAMREVQGLDLEDRVGRRKNKKAFAGFTQRRP
jgi:hypothetical protein